MRVPYEFAASPSKILPVHIPIISLLNEITVKTIGRVTIISNT
jgi:hypothetical protein